MRRYSRRQVLKLSGGALAAASFAPLLSRAAMAQELPTGQTLGDAIDQIDDATSGYPAYYMINCAHPTHFDRALEGDWLERIGGIRANASSKSHAELNESTELDIGDPAELGAQYAELKKRLPRLSVLGGCCGTDHRHIEQIAAACAPLFG